MNITLIQSSLEWEDAEANRKRFSSTIDSISVDTDIIILPEMFSSGFTMNPSAVAETMDGETVRWMKELSAKKNSAICGSVVIIDKGNFYNRFLFVKPSGEIQHYDKRHLFTLAGEDKVYSSGRDKLIVEYKGWRICPLVCYDLRFPVFSRNVENYDLLLYVANWPEPRVNAWDVLLKARAIENMAYVAGVNRVGKDDNGHNYLGHSQVVDCLGKNIVEPAVGEGVFTCTLDKNQMLETRQKFGFLNDRDDFTVS
ncbi:MAG: amidohydrolase [Flavobacterium sp.]|nr:MAG: amidohydrolase [Flavobacterium sp.]